MPLLTLGNQSRSKTPLPAFRSTSTKVRSDHSDMSANEKRSLPTSSSERFTSEAGGTRTRNLRIDSPAEQSSNTVKPQRVAKRRSHRGSSGGSSSPENEHGEAGRESVSSRAESPPIKVDSFSAALAMIASLPLSDAEKADAVRRLMAERGEGVAGDGR
jgi:hypothetical protein